MASTAEINARRYCASIGAHPDEIVRGYDKGQHGALVVYDVPRWRCYVGAIIEGRPPLSAA